MFPTFSTFSSFPVLLRTCFLRLITGCALTVLTQLAGAQTLADIQSLMKEGNLPQALAQAERYITAQPRDAQGPFIKGVILSEMGRPQDAIAVFTDLTERFPELPEPYNNLAVLYAQQRQYEKAQMALEMAIRTHPSYAIAHENLGDIYAKLASQAYDKALQLDSSNKAAQTKLSMIGELMGVPARPNVKPATLPKTGSAPTQVAAAEPFIPVMPVPAEAVPVKSVPAVSEPAAVPPQAVPTPPQAATTPPQAATTPPQAATTPPQAVPTPPQAATTPPQAVPTPPQAVPTPPQAVPTPPQTAAVKTDGDKKTEAGATDGVAKTESEITGIVRDWAAAWSRKDVPAYLAFYSADFQPPRRMALREWKTERRQRIDKPGKLQVSIDDVKVSVSGDKVTARFRQRYVSANFKSQTGKALVFTKSGARWLIVQERVI